MQSEKDRIALLFGVLPDQLMPGWEVLLSQPSNQKPEWLYDFLDGAPNLKAAYEKGTAMFERDKGGNIVGHFTPDYYLDLMEEMKGKDLRDPWGEPWGSGKRKSVDDLYPGYNSQLNRENPNNQRWAVQQCMAHETRLKTVVPHRGPGRSPALACEF